MTTTDIAKAIAMNTLKALTQDGKAVIIVGSGGGKAVDPEQRKAAYFGMQNRAFFFNLYRNFNVTSHFTVSGDLYAKQGAGWPIDIIAIDGRGRSALSFPWQDAPGYINDWNELAGRLPGAAGGPVSGVAGAGLGTGGGAHLPGPGGEPQGPAGGVPARNPEGSGLRPGGAAEAGGGRAGGHAPERPSLGDPIPNPVELSKDVLNQRSKLDRREAAYLAVKHGLGLT